LFVCGIFGIVTGTHQKIGDILISAGERLSYRGYDSVGCATLDSDSKIDLRKDVGKIGEVAKQLNFSEMYGCRGIIQLRWATFGNPSKENAQPHIDSDGDLVGAHNGNVVNNLELRQKFISEGLTVRSTNDGESCVHAVESYLLRGENMLKSIQLAYGDLAGDYAFIIASTHENCLRAVKKGSGLVIGIGDNFTCVSSDLPSIIPLTRKIIYVYDGEIVTLYPDRIEINKVIDGTPVSRPVEIIKESMESVEKGGFPHFMLKEIHEQPVVAKELINLLDYSENLPDVLEFICHARNIYLIGCGTSYHACILGAVYFAQYAGIVTIPILAPQFIVQYGPTLSKNDVCIFVSQSGETKDILNAVHYAKSRHVKVVGIVNVIGSSLIQLSDTHLPLGCGYEISVPATKTFINEIIMFAYMAMRIGTKKKRGAFSALPELLERTISNTEMQVINLTERLKHCNDMYCVGYVLTYPIALEGALKLKEITYAHCEGMLSTEFKHGPLSAITDNYPVIFIAAPSDIPIIISGINETTCRGGYAIGIGVEDPQLIANTNYTISLPEADSIFFPMLATIPVQLLSYKLSILRDINPDFPRNLSKTLTVD
jgi:glucosamine--fructose-6-phosphate aminotransferase (isomerizing)